MSRRHAAIAGMLASLLLASGCGNASLMTSSGAVAPAIAAHSASTKAAARFTNRLVVKFRSSTSESQVRAFQQRFSLSSVRRFSALGIGVMGLPANRKADQVLATIQGHPAIEYAEPDYIYHVPQVKPRAKAARKTLSTTRFSEQWGLLKIEAPRLWPVNAGSPGVTVAVLDTGVDMRHPDLRPNLVPGVSVLPNASGPDDDHGHGTHVSGIIAGTGARAVHGAAPRCKIMPVKVLNREGKGDTGDIVTGLLWAVNNGASVINMSLGGPGGSRALREAVAYALSKEVVVVAAMGNEGANSQEYPAGYPGVIAVGATTEDEQRAEFSNFGSWISVSAPGESIYSTLPMGRFYLQEMEGKDSVADAMDGTSMAAPFVAGVAALVKSQHPGLPAAAVKARIERSAIDLGEPGFDSEFGHGRVNVYRAVFGPSPE